MGNPMVSKCPVCSSGMEVTRMYCEKCDTSLEGHFSPCKFCQLTNEQREFIEVFLASRGNIKEVEKLLQISYPTVRSRLETVIESLGYRVEREETKRRKEILEALDKQEITSDEAIRLLKNA